MNITGIAAKFHHLAPRRIADLQARLDSPFGSQHPNKDFEGFLRTQWKNQLDGLRGLLTFVDASTLPRLAEDTAVEATLRSIDGDFHAEIKPSEMV